MVKSLNLFFGKRILENEIAVFRFPLGSRVVPRENEMENGKTEGKTKAPIGEGPCFPRAVRFVFRPEFY